MSSSRAAFLFAATCVPLLAQQQPDKPQVVKLASPLPVSTQGKAAEAVDIVVTAVHAPPNGEKCESKAPDSCAAGEHWQVEVKLGGTAAQGKTFALSDTEPLQKQVEWAASPKAQTKHTDRVNISDATLAMHLPAGAPYPIVQRLIHSVAAAGVHRIEFAVVPAPGAAEQRLRVPLPAEDGQPVLVDDPKAAPPELRIALFADAKTGACTRLFGRTKLADGAAGDAELSTKLKEAMAKKKEPAIIDAAAGVPWQSVVAVIDACHVAGATVEFARSPAAKAPDKNGTEKK